MSDAGNLAKRYVANSCTEVNIFQGVDTYRDSSKDVPQHAKLVFAVFYCDAEIRNGGLRQLFRNSTGMLVPEAIIGFQTLGLPVCAEILAEASKLFGDAYPLDKNIRHEIIESLEYPGGDPNLITEYEPDINAIMNKLHLATRKPIVRPFAEFNDAYYAAVTPDEIGLAADAYISQKE